MDICCEQSSCIPESENRLWNVDASMPWNRSKGCIIEKAYGPWNPKRNKELCKTASVRINYIA